MDSLKRFVKVVGRFGHCGTMTPVAFVSRVRDEMKKMSDRELMFMYLMAFDDQRLKSYFDAQDYILEKLEDVKGVFDKLGRERFMLLLEYAMFENAKVVHRNYVHMTVIKILCKSYKEKFLLDEFMRFDEMDIDVWEMQTKYFVRYMEETLGLLSRDELLFIYVLSGLEEALDVMFKPEDLTQKLEEAREQLKYADRYELIAEIKTRMEANSSLFHENYIAVLLDYCEWWKK
ncbi:MAG: hypothetical protein KatS3mg083_607 [Candidatus Dojkabacteria bacterium]|nr:MAG: hypothetical protein KatS3mg083_607 [Candidatus Dojkabacteria bacterium]